MNLKPIYTTVNGDPGWAVVKHSNGDVLVSNPAIGFVTLTKGQGSLAHRLLFGLAEAILKPQAVTPAPTCAPVQGDTEAQLREIMQQVDVLLGSGWTRERIENLEAAIRNLIAPTPACAHTHQAPNARAQVLGALESKP